MVSQITDFFNKHEVLNKSQHCFRVGMFTVTAVANFMHEVMLKLDIGLKSSSVMINLTKTLDCINHEKLLQIQQYGIKGQANNLVSSFLHNRKQYAEILF